MADWTEKQNEIALAMRTDGKTVEEIAKILGKSPGSVQAKFKRMKKAGIDVPDSPNDPAKKKDGEKAEPVTQEKAEESAEVETEVQQPPTIPDRIAITDCEKTGIEQIIIDTSDAQSMEIRVSRTRRQIAVFINKRTKYFTAPEEWRKKPLLWKKGGEAQKGQPAQPSDGTEDWRGTKGENANG